MKNYFKNLAKFLYVSFIYGVILVSGIIVSFILITAGAFWLAWPYFLLHYSPWCALLFILSFGSFLYLTSKLDDY